MDTANNNNLATIALPYWELWGTPVAVMLLVNLLRLPHAWTALIFVLLTFGPEKCPGKYRN